ncbi:ARM repeat superfamily protein [Artemisia annua]|uniref:ARM repeat superfamily protein n=1 Tax=Artemisia annua TaxID=35608 RepID=A0A2U1KR39_ARTAN|nr:ARM repeat superfamily protein [Artemisia annua]
MEEVDCIVLISDKLKNGDDLEMKIEAAREIRSMIRNRNNSGEQIRSKFGGAGVIKPLVGMLSLENDDAVEVSLLALLNLASKNKRNKEEIVTYGAISSLVNILKFQNTSNLGELAIAAILTLSASSNNKAAIVNSEAIPLLIQIISSGTIQGRADAVNALHNLATSKQEPTIILDTIATSPLIGILKECKKYSKFAERATALIEIISKSQEGINAITNAEDGILTLVETVEGGSLVSKEHALSVLLTLCISSRSKYRELILNEGAIPGLLRLTIDGTHQGQSKAKMLLGLLRDSPSEKKLSQSVLEKMVQEIAARVNKSERRRAETAKKLMQDLVQRRMARV